MILQKKSKLHCSFLWFSLIGMLRPLNQKIIYRQSLTHTTVILFSLNHPSLQEKLGLVTSGISSLTAKSRHKSQLVTKTEVVICRHNRSVTNFFQRRKCKRSSLMCHKIRVVTKILMTSFVTKFVTNSCKSSLFWSN